MTEEKTKEELEELIIKTSKIDISDLLCPICADVFVWPRNYDCGHTVCETCMYNMDIRQLPEDTHIAVIYRCPVCRDPTLKSWNNRPLSFLLERYATQHPDYQKRKKEVTELKKLRKETLVSISDSVDLASTCYVARINLALDLYEILLEKLYNAAKEGKNHLIITERSIVSEIEKVGDILSYQLFSKHNIYRMLTTRGECTIYLTRNAFSWRRNFENRNWEDPTGPTIDSMRENGPPPLPMVPPPQIPVPPPVETHSPLIHRRSLRRTPVSSPSSYSRRT